MVRPSYVLGGQGMKIVINKEELVEHVVDLLRRMPGNKFLLDHYLDGAIEAEADAICDAMEMFTLLVLWSILNLVEFTLEIQCNLPAFQFRGLCMQQIKDHTIQLLEH